MIGNILHGIVHGKTIQLDDDSGLPDGQAVRVVVQPVLDPQQALEGLRKSFGAWADDVEGLDEYLEWSRQQRKVERPENST